LAWEQTGEKPVKQVGSKGDWGAKNACFQRENATSGERGSEPHL
jgi:hypothetical protein